MTSSRRTWNLLEVTPIASITSWQNNTLNNYRNTGNVVDMTHQDLAEGRIGGREGVGDFLQTVELARHSKQIFIG